MHDPRRPQVAHEADLRLPLLTLEVLDQFASRIQTPVIRHAENPAHEAIRQKPERGRARGDGVLVLLGPVDGDEHAFEVIGVLGRLVDRDADLFEQVGRYIMAAPIGGRAIGSA